MRELCKKLNLVSLRKIVKITDSIHSEAFKNVSDQELSNY